MLTLRLTPRLVLASHQSLLHSLPNAYNGNSIKYFTSKTSSLMKNMIVNVPTMGDSITEGTIVSWTVNVGQAVKEGDVVCLIETDKVTVDIKAQMDGVIRAHFGKQDDTVTVGEKLYEIDNDTSQLGTNYIDLKLGSEILKPELESVDSSSNQARVPAIKFLGKQGWSSRRSTESVSKLAPDDGSTKGHTPISPPASPPKSQPSVTKPQQAITVQAGIIRSNFGRGRISSQEIESLLLGGASTAENIIPNKKQNQRD